MIPAELENIQSLLRYVNPGENSNLRGAQFDFAEEGIRKNKYSSLFREWLILLGEKWPKSGTGLGGVWLSREQTTQFIVGRSIVGEGERDLLWLGLRFSPMKADQMLFDSWPLTSSPIKHRLHNYQRVVGRNIFYSGFHLVDFIEELGVPYHKDIPHFKMKFNRTNDSQ